MRGPDRKQLTHLTAGLAKGDVLIVTRLDRLARSTRDLHNLLGTIAEKDAMGQRRDSCKIVASINLQLTEPPNAETPRQQ